MEGLGFRCLGFRVIQTLDHTHRPQSSSFWGLPYRILNMNPKKELPWGPMGKRQTPEVTTAAGTKAQAAPWADGRLGARRAKGSAPLKEGPIRVAGGCLGGVGV